MADGKDDDGDNWQLTYQVAPVRATRPDGRDEYRWFGDIFAPYHTVSYDGRVTQVTVCTSFALTAREMSDALKNKGQSILGIKEPDMAKKKRKPRGC